MVAVQVSQILLGVYVGLLASLFPAFIAFAIGFGFKYFTNVTVPALGVVVLSGALAGVSGGLMGFVDPQLANSWTGITATAVILMASLWAHSQGDKLAVATPRGLTLKTLRESRLSVDLVERIDIFGQVHIRPLGGIQDIEGYPPLSEDLRERVHAGSWKFPADLSRGELESKLEERLLADFELAEVAVSIDERGRAEIAAAPTAAGLSRRVPPGKRAVTVQTLLPTGVARGDVVSLELPDGTVSGPVVSARTASVAERDAEPVSPIDQVEGPAEPIDPPASTTAGGEGQVTVVCSPEDAERVLRTEFAPLIVHSRGTQREYEAIALLRNDGNRFRRLDLDSESELVGQSIGGARVRDRYGVAILAVRRGSERLIAPGGTTELRAGDSLIVVGRPSQIRAFEEVTR
ncbi:MAG: TrkA C-terminal domain-containing protein [Halodesulfurarchaeum sp.]|nr:TrkA C-terminal domain-containing protein [Halodesulfurarchaeum sp.]